MKAESIVKRVVRTACICLLICLGSALCVQAATQESETLKTAKEEGPTGLVLIKEKLYVLDENSEPATGTKVHTVKVGEEYYLVNKKCIVAPKGWNQVGKKKYYVRNKKGKLIAGGVQKVKKKYYYFTKKGKLSVKKKDRIVMPLMIRVPPPSWMPSSPKRQTSPWRSFWRSRFLQASS